MKQRFCAILPLTVWLSLWIALGCAFTPRTASAAIRPNIILILADDLGWRDLSCQGSTFYETPHLDRLAASGMRFTDAYAACNVCSPTRASIVTGKYPARLNLTDWLPGRPDRKDQKLKRPNIVRNLPLEEQTIAERLKGEGYATAFIGKWHLGDKGFWPDEQGFDVNLGGCEKGTPPSYFSPYRLPTLADGPPGEYLTDRLGEEAVKFIRSSRDKPFLLFLWHYAVHNPQQAKSNLVAKYRRKLENSGPGTMPEFITDKGRRVRQVQNQPVYAAMVESMDASVGRILDTLAELRIDTNTIVVFTSDNGGLSTSEGTPTSNMPLRMGKGWNYEGGIREPLIVRWPGVTPAGSTSAVPVTSVDLAPTFLEAAGVRGVEGGMDGKSLVRVLGGEAIPERPLYWHYPHYSNQGGPPSGAVRLGSYKLIEFFEDDRVELYDLARDPGEKTDLAPQHAEKAKAMRGMLAAWRTQVGARMPTPNPDYTGTAAR